MKLFVDMDGVLADFNVHYNSMFGVMPDRKLDNVDWALLRKTADFYAGIPPMADIDVLWKGIESYKPTILTGLPWSVLGAEANKRDWVKKNLGSHVEVICCPSSEKYLRATPGDILIDDWEKYRSKWELAGGYWITHVSAKQTIFQLECYTMGF